MKPYLQDPDFTLYNGDALEVLRELPAESVQMCVTSPPFFGLRDYGTGTWEGGYADDCDHKRPRGGLKSGLNAKRDPITGGLAEDSHAHPEHVYKNLCGKCGARRVDRQIGLESTPEAWVASLVAVFDEVKRVLRKDGTLWVECGDSYGGAPVGSFNGGGFKDKSALMGTRDMRGVATSGSIDKAKAAGVKPKDLIGQPFLLAFALREAGWYWRNVCIWQKPNPMPESVRDRFTVSHSYVLLFSKSPRYFFDAEAVRETVSPLSTFKPWSGAVMPSSEARSLDGPSSERFGNGSRGDPSGRNARSVWTISTEPLPFEHYAAFPQALAERCIKAGTSERGCCPECGAPWVREEKLGDLVPSGNPTGSASNKDTHSPKMGARFFNPEAPAIMRYERETIGWQPSCQCLDPRNPKFVREKTAPPPIPCTVLDPFMGSGTSALVARRLNRRCIGIELNEKYCDLAAKRTQQLSLLGEEPQEPTPPLRPHKGLTGGAYSPPGQSPHSNARPSEDPSPDVSAESFA